VLDPSGQASPAERQPCRTAGASFAPLSYGADQIPIFCRAAVLVDKILKGAKPADLPVELPTRFQFRINLKIAGAVGIAISAELLSRANEVIE
jgi:putative ABC transport system substrate-binding protein